VATPKSSTEIRDLYLTEFEALLEGLAQGGAVRSQGLSNLAAKFFGLNAVAYLGLRKGDPARTRLEAFYANNSVPTPDWMNKVDALVSA
jgi:hypothetical protein